MIDQKDKEEYGLIHLPVIIVLLRRYVQQINANRATIHHGAYSMHNLKDINDIDAIIDLLYQWHVKENKWKAIGYPLMIIPDGRLVFLYRAFKGLQGAHCKTTNNPNSGNTNNLGALVWGNFNEEHPTEAQEKMINALRGSSEAYCNIDKYYLHRDLNDTSCPGENFPVELWKP